MALPYDTFTQHADLIGLLFEANDAERSLRHARSSLLRQPPLLACAPDRGAGEEP